MRVGITGAGGYVGEAVAARFALAGHEVVALTRRPTGPHEHRPYDLAGELPASALDGLDAVLHAAYDMSLTDPGEIWRVNVGATRRLVEATRRGRTRLILISSMSAYAGTRQLYGRAKLECEAVVLGAGGDAIRLGLVHGGADRGMFGSLRRIARLPVVPLIGARSHQFLVHVDDATNGLLALASAGEPPGKAVGLAHPDPIAFRELIEQIGLAQGHRARVVPLAWQPVYLAMRAAERVRVPLPIRADSVLGLVRPAPAVPSFDLWQRLGVTVRPFTLDREHRA